MVDGWCRKSSFKILQIMSKLSFTPGTAVEVNFQVDHHSNIWYPGTVSKILGEGLYAVKYDSLNKAGGHEEVVVNSIHIRPSPPSYNHKNFQLLEKVEAFYNSGWSSGVVTKLLSEQRYIVYFKHTRKEKELPHSDLRLPVSWNDGIWVHSSQNNSVIPNSEEAAVVCNPCTNGNAILPPDTSAAVKESDKKSKGEDQEVPSGGLLSEGTSMSTTRRVSKKPVMEGYATPSRASKKQVMEGSATPSIESKDQAMECIATETKVSKQSTKDDTPKLKSCEVSVLMTSTAEESIAKVGPGIKTLTSAMKEAPCGGAIENTNQSDIVYASQERMLDIKDEEEELPTHVESTTKKRGWPKGKLRGNKRSSGKPQKETAANESLLRSTGNSVIISLPCSDLGNSSNDGTPRHVPHEKTMELLKEGKKQLLDDFNQHGDIFEVSPMKRKRGRPPGSGKKKSVEGKKSMQEHRKVLSSKRRRKARAPVKSGGGRAFEEVVMDFGAHAYVSKGRKVKTTMSITSATHEFQSPLRKKDEIAFTDRVAKNADESRVESVDVTDDDRPLSTWHLESNPPLAIEYTKHSLAGNTSQNGEDVQRNNSVTNETNGTEGDVHGGKNVDQCEPSLIQKKVGENADQCEPSIRQEEDEIADPKSKALPFTKTSTLLWEMINAMDVFKQLPQEPHFRPLYSCAEHCREGLAIGSMVTFAGLVQKISNFQFDDPRSILESSLEALVDLEKHGFDVGAVRSRLTSLLEIKSKHEQSWNKSKETENLLTDRSQEKAEIDKEVTEIDRRIEELMQKRAAIVLEKQKKEEEIAALESSVGELKKSVEVAQSEFDRVVSAPW